MWRVLSLVGSHDEKTMTEIALKEERDANLNENEGKDRVIMLTAEQDASPMKSDIADFYVSLHDNDDEDEGPILANGEVNWQCPCMASLVSGPCGFEYRQAFGCYHNSTTDPKGIDCVEKFAEMSLCMQQYPKLYPAASKLDREDEKLEEILTETVIDDEKSDNNFREDDSNS